MLCPVFGIGIPDVTFMSVGTTASTASVASTLDVGDVVVGFTMNSGAAERPISNAGATAFTGDASPSATSAGAAGWYVAAGDDPATTCSGGTTTRFQIFGWRLATKITGAHLDVVSGTSITIPAIAHTRSGGIPFVSIMSETAGLTVSADSLGLGSVDSTNVTGASRHFWAGVPSSGYAGGTLTVDSGEWWVIFGIAE